MARRKPYYGQCTVRRTSKVTHGTVNMVSGKSTKGRTEIVTEACGTPLFGEPENTTGICRACAEGWEVPDNRFADPKEKERAMEKARTGLADRIAAQRRKMASLVRAMTDEEAKAFLERGHDYRRTWMVKNLDGQWGQTIEDAMKRLVGKKLGILKGDVR